MVQTNTDPRSSSSIALDEAVTFLRRHVPDRFPADAHPLLLAAPSLLSAAAGELARRYGTALPGHRQMLEALPRQLLAYSPSLAELRETFGMLGRAIDAHNAARSRKAAPLAPHPPAFLELAADLKLTLPAARDEAMAMLRVAIDASVHDARCRIPASHFAFGVPENVEACFLRRALIETGMPPMQRGSVFERSESQLRPRPPKFIRASNARELSAAGWMGNLPSWFDPFIRENGGTVIGGLDDREVRAEHERRIGVADAGNGQPGTKRAAADTWRQEQGIKLKATHLAALEQQREHVVAKLDELISSLPIGCALWWSCEARRHVALDPNDRPLVVGLGLSLNGAPVAIAMLRAFNLSIDLGATP